MLLCEQNFWDVWSRNESVRAEIGQILHTHAAKLVVEISIILNVLTKNSKYNMDKCAVTNHK